MTRPAESVAHNRREIAADSAAASRPMLHEICMGVLAAIFVSRFFLPAESAAQGDTLWIAGMWFLCGIVWTVGIWRGLLPPLRCDWLDVTVAVWIGSQVVSAIVIVLTVGEKRSATNLAWEWLALGVVWLIVRHGFVQWADRRALVRAMIVSGVVLSAYGLYQHYVSHPRLAAEYGPLFDRLRTASGTDADRIRQKLARDGIPTDGPALILFEKRLRDSREPLGMFALANTFGGFLAVCLLLTLGEIISLRQCGSGWRSLIPWIAAAAIVSWCLLLTKSRTAWIGSLCGATVLAVLQLQMTTNYRRWLRPVGLSLVAIGVVTVAMIFLGGLDRQVLSEAPKSLAYRIQYWQATSRLILDHWGLGVGPGNFRQHYLKYKLPEASEEIADPHNLFFEVAATGGAISAIGLMLFLAFAFVKAWRDIRPDLEQSQPRLNDTTHPALPASLGLTFWMAGIGVFLAFAGPLVFLEEWEDRVLILAVLWGIVAWAFGVIDGKGSGTSKSRSRGLSQATLAAGVALAVHLLGAGGIGMPGVSQMLVALLALSLAPAIPCRESGRRSGILLAGSVFSIMLIGLVATALLPVWKCRWLLRHGHAAGMVAGPNKGDAAMTFYRQAGDVDPWSPEPWQQQFEWSMAGGIQSNESFEIAVKQLHEVMNRDPVNFWAPRTLGTIWHQKWRMTGDLEDARQAVKWLSQARERYPTNSGIQAELALAYDSAREVADAANVAAAALAQDDVYHRYGHVDRYLSNSIRERLQILAAESSR